MSKGQVANPGHTDTPWVFSSNSHQEILAQMEGNSLQAIETVKLTSRGSFKEATVSAKEGFIKDLVFSSLIDINLARSESITPLPIIE